MEKWTNEEVMQELKKAQTAKDINGKPYAPPEELKRIFFDPRMPEGYDKIIAAGLGWIDASVEFANNVSKAITGLPTPPAKWTAQEAINDLRGRTTIKDGVRHLEEADLRAWQSDPRQPNIIDLQPEIEKLESIQRQLNEDLRSLGVKIEPPAVPPLKIPFFRRMLNKFRKGQ